MHILSNWQVGEFEVKSWVTKKTPIYQESTVKELGFLLGWGIEERVRLRKKWERERNHSIWGLAEGKCGRINVSKAVNVKLSTLEEQPKFDARKGRMKKAGEMRSAHIFVRHGLR